MTTGADVLSSQPVVSLRDMYMAEYASVSGASAGGQVPAILLPGSD
jgi:hypothetical protein